MNRFLIALFALAIASPLAAQYPGGGGSGGDSGGGRSGRHGGESGDPSEGGAALTRREPQRAMKPIPRDVFDAEVRRTFTEADLDHDGIVTLNEIRAAREAKREAMINAKFASIDINHDDSISHDEFLAWQKHLGDPEMARGEHPEDAPHPPEDGGRDAGPRGEHGPRGAGMVGFLIVPLTANMIVEADTNHDGALSLAEDLAYQDAVFDKVDTNKDGFLDEGEIRAARVARERR